MLKKMVILPSLGLITTLAVSCGAKQTLSKEDTKTQRDALVERLVQLEKKIDDAQQDRVGYREKIKELEQNNTHLLEQIKELKQKIKKLETAYFGVENEVRIISKTLDGKQEMDQIYQIQNGQKMFSDLLLWINEFEVEQKIVNQPRFGFRDPHAKYGLFVNSVNGVFADYDEESNSWWSILSPTFGSDYTNNSSPLEYRRDFDLSKFDDNEVRPWFVNKGVSSLPLIGRQILVFWQSPN
ncbi:hypothetical protein [Mycoplasma sp. ATU-Cv-508]|uniref:hypothetical protein n=1 Tax=Mycoplasma sp. ATU-Cv-508 TaxID=2048001 RepID=UPI000FDEC6CB